MPFIPKSTSAEEDPVIVLQNRWYNGLTSHLNLDRFTFQLRHPAINPIRSTQELWAVQNVMPPLSLTFDSVRYPDQRLFDAYATAVKQLQFPENRFRADIGEVNFHKWMTYLKQITPPPSDSKLPALFRQWSFLSAPSATSVGTADLSQMALARQAFRDLQAYQGANAKTVDFLENYDSILNLLKHSAGASFVFDPNMTVEKVSDTWAGGNNNELTGLLRSKPDMLTLSRQFAQSHVHVDVRFKAVGVFTSVPGQWYNSSLLNAAYSNQTSPPWPVNPNPTWEDLFGPSGTMRRLIISLVVVDEADITIVSNASYREEDQQTIQNNASGGLWPFYISDDRDVARNMVTFNNVGKMKITIKTQPGNPIVIGNGVLPTAQYLGHATPAP